MVWIFFLIHIIRQQSIYDLVGPTENPYWGIAQFRIAADDFKVELLKYKYGVQRDSDAIRFKYEILVSKFFIISQRSETTQFAYQQPLYYSVVADLDKTFARMDEWMTRFPVDSEATDSLIAASSVFDTAYDQFVSAVGLSEVRRRDALLVEALQNRSMLLYSNIGVSLLFFVAVVIFARSIRNFRQALRTAQQVAHTKQVFLAAINHELRNPLQTIVSANENISHYATSQDLMHAAINIDHAVTHIETHMRDLTDYLRLQTNKVNLRISTVDLQKIVNEAVRIFKSKAEEKGIRINSTIYTPLTKFISDEQRVQQIIYNLVENSIKYSASGTVQIRCGIPSTSDGSLVTIEITDEGVGIDKGVVNFLFSPFFQSSIPENSAVSGYGMGLAVVRGLVEVLGGQISVDSDIGKGATFTVKLPYRSYPMPDVLLPIKIDPTRADADNHP
ncbi:sensor histidine kinase [Burkholderia sp. FL-7-2-10-S1-D7]|uniref:sensor histidine kinase n=1 Tax=Burkholderia sp. FL-7-2-10-S1-D7 TaxID=1637866 RepID=UPI00211D99A6|nr:HAMP domain-containing sensor histidine kinase [Burkholderia sp. FL-7-2-10-S1-D7]